MVGTRELVLGVGTVGLGFADSAGSPDVVLDLPQGHPTTHGALRIRVVLDGDRVVSADPVVGHLHRGAEKLFEVRDYRQAMALANRHDWLAAFHGELGIALAVERMLGLQVPERATWIRTLLAELTRVVSHLAFLGALPLEDGRRTSALVAHGEREALLDLLEEVSGARIHVMLAQVGGLREDLPDGWLDQARRVVAQVRSGLSAFDDLVLRDTTWRDPLRGVGVLDRETALRHGVSGPLARAAGLDLDLRRDEPYLAYAELAPVLRVVGRTEGDALARTEVLLEQVHVSLDLVEACADRVEALGAGPVSVRLPKVLKAPEGHTYCWTETPLGIAGYLLVSRGEKTPWRLKLRSASFNNVSALGEVLAGEHLADVAAILASMFLVVGDIDR